MATDLMTRLMRRIDWSGGPLTCWPVKRGHDKDGYGQFSVGAQGQAKNKRTHRVAYELFVGPIPDGYSVCHRCDNPPCCNPSHLFAASNAENHRDKAVKGRAARGERSPAARLTAVEVRAIRDTAEAGARHGDLATAYGVSRPAISQIVSRKTWRHIA